MYIDKPAPGTGYLILLWLSFILALVAPFVLNRFVKSKMPLFWGLTVIFIGTAMVFGIILHAAYNTEYRIENQKLTLHCGYMMQAEIRLDIHVPFVSDGGRVPVAGSLEQAQTH